MLKPRRFTYFFTNKVTIVANQESQLINPRTRDYDRLARLHRVYRVYNFILHSQRSEKKRKEVSYSEILLHSRNSEFFIFEFLRKL